MRIQTRRPMKIGYEMIKFFSKLFYNYFMWGDI
jgi:hypothetical protein